MLLNTHGVVEIVTGENAVVRFDEGDRQRLIRASGKEYPATVPASIAILDKVETGK